MDERGRIAMLARILQADAPGIDRGIGDDAAVLLSGQAEARLVWTIDEQIEGAHFRRDLTSWHDVGWRGYMAAASDIAAMGAKPWCALCALALPDDVDDAALESIAMGQRDAAAVAGAPIVGGNLARGPVLSMTTTFLGLCDRAITRAGAQVGDSLWLAGRVGPAAAGLRALLERRAQEAVFEEAVGAWRTPRALFEFGRALAGVANAAVDVSDGLARDVGHIAEASAVQIVLDEAALVDEGLERAAAALRASALDLALHGGEDYALVATSPVPIEGFRPIGVVRSGLGLVLRSANSERPIEPRGHDHFPARVAART